MKISAPLCVLPLFALCSCSTPTVITPVLHGSAQTVSYEQGRPIITEAQPPTAAVATVVNPEADGNVVFWVGVTNYSKAPMSFGLENVGVESENKPVRVYTHAELVRHEKVKLGIGIAATILGAAAGAAAASIPSTVHTNANVYGNSGRYLGTIRSSSTVYNPAQTALAASVFASAGAANSVALQGGYRANVAALQDVLQVNTVAPGETRGGLIFAKDSGDLEKGYTVHVRFGGRQRDFTFKEAK